MNDLLKEALEIAINSLDYHGEYHKADILRAYLADSLKDQAREEASK